MKVYNFGKTYLFHENSIIDFQLNKSKLIIHLENGIYNCITNTVEDSKIELEIENFHKNQLYGNIIISKNKKRNISIRKFKKLLLKNKFKIYLDLYSSVFNVILLKGTINKMELEIFISEVCNVQVGQKQDY